MSKCKCVIFNHAWQMVSLIRAPNCVLGYYRHALKVISVPATPQRHKFVYSFR